MSVEHIDGLLPLRQTCDRCRELKVRCQRDKDNRLNEHALPSCIRCIRTGAICTYSPQQRSGRRPSARHAYNNTSLDGIPSHAKHKKQRQRAASILSSFPTDPNPFRPNDNNSLSSSTSGVAPATNRSPSILPEWSWYGLDMGQSTHSPHAADHDHRFEMQNVDLHCIGDEVQTNATFSVDSEGISGSSTMHDGPAADPASVTMDDTEKDIMDLSRLSLRIHKILTTTTMKPAPSNDLIDITRSLLRILKRVVKLAAPPRHHMNTSRQSTSPESHSSSIGPHSVDVSVYSDDISTATGSNVGLDIATVLMVQSCHQRLLDLFMHTCLSMKAQIASQGGPMNSYTHGGEAADALRLENNDVLSPCESDTYSSTAECVMTTELIIHLVDRLERGQRQLMAVLDLESASPSSKRRSSCATSQPDSRSETQSRSPAERQQICSDFLGVGAEMTRPNYHTQVAKVILDAISQKQSSLQAHIVSIKRSIEECEAI